MFKKILLLINLSNDKDVSNTDSALYTIIGCIWKYMVEVKVLTTDDNLI